jgi:hypothetical protein
MLLVLALACAGGPDGKPGDGSSADAGDADTDTDTDTDPTERPFQGDLSASDASGVLYGDADYDRNGSDLAWVDVDAEGALDLVTLAGRASDPADGSAYLAGFRGLPGGTSTLRDATWTIGNNLPAPDSQIRWVGSGELTGDGATDLLVERTLEGGGAEAVLLAAPFDAIGTLGNSAIRLHFSTGGEALTWAAVPDVTGDGSPDVLAGDPLFTDFADQSGKVWVFAGPLEGVREENLAFAVLRSTDFREGIGGALAAADVDGDGIADAIAGSTVEHVYGVAGPILGAPIVQQDWAFRWTYDPAETHDSSVYTGPVWAGDATGDGHVDLLFGSQDLRLVPGPLAGDLSEADVAAVLPGALRFSAGDVDADGTLDLLTGDGAYDPGVSAREGAASLYYGPLSGAVEGPDARFGATAPLDELGTAVALGDADGDGRADLAIGAPGLDDEGFDRGAVLVFRTPD